MFNSRVSYYVEHPGNSREVEQEEKDIKLVVKLMKRHGIQVLTQNVTKTAVNIEIPTTIDAGKEASSELLLDIASLKGELNNGHIYIKRPVLWSYGYLGFVLINLSSWMFWGWWKWREEIEMF